MLGMNVSWIQETPIQTAAYPNGGVQCATTVLHTFRHCGSKMYHHHKQIRILTPSIMTPFPPDHRGHFQVIKGTSHLKGLQVPSNGGYSPNIISTMMTSMGLKGMPTLTANQFSLFFDRCNWSALLQVMSW